MRRHADIVPTIFEAYRVAVTGVPGPVFVEIPANVQLFRDDVPAFQPPLPPEAPDDTLIEEAARVLASAERPGIFVGWGAVDATEALVEIAERLGAPVATTLQYDSGHRVNPVRFFDALRAVLPDEAIVTVDNGNHTYLTAELFEVRRPRTLIVPSDFNCMGYAVPAAVGARLAHPDRPVVAVVGDGAFLMTGLELLTARRMKVGVVCCVFHDGELSQISQGQEVAYNRKTCTVIGDVRFEGIAQAVGARYVLLPGDTATMRRTLQEALEWAADGDSVIVEVPIDYSRRTRFTQGVVKTVMARFPTGDRLRFVGRALWRRLWG